LTTPAPFLAARSYADSVVGSFFVSHGSSSQHSATAAFKQAERLAKDEGIHLGFCVCDWLRRHISADAL